MRFGLHALGIGAGADRLVIDAVAAAADRCGFATLWFGEHVIRVDRTASRYPYADDGQIAIPSTSDWIDPMIGMSFAAAASSTIRLGSGVLLLPEHNPVVVAKQAATLDVLSGGRLTLGVGIGWMREEFDALGIPFERRGARTAEYVAAMRTLWREDVASFNGEFVNFDAVRMNPKPAAGGRIPVVLGGNGDAAMRRVVSWADGWYGFNLDGVQGVADRVALINVLCAESGRDRSELRLAVALRELTIDDVRPLADLGVDELVLVEGPPSDASAVEDWLSALADKWFSALP
jgi:probable F420-dependent oxidoreductase